LCNFIVNVLILTILILSLPLLLSKLTNRPIYIDKEFSEYFSEFEKDATNYKVKLNLYKVITVFSSSVKIGTAGYCVPSTKTIVISKDVWLYLDKATKKALLYHEWGHCILRREHTTEYNYVTYCPISIMYPLIDSFPQCYPIYQDSYNRELFTNPYNYKKFSRSTK
jgi:hypothetical protein